MKIKEKNDQPPDSRGTLAIFSVQVSFIRGLVLPGGSIRLWPSSGSRLMSGSGIKEMIVIMNGDERNPS